MITLDLLYDAQALLELTVENIKHNIDDLEAGETLTEDDEPLEEECAQHLRDLAQAMSELIQDYECR